MNSSEIGSAVQRVPTVDDLRVKLCYICREEEQHDQRPNPPVAWVHPCNCTLVAHESCLLNWIKSAQADSQRSGNALKCPQCSAVYELESNYPLSLKVLNHLNASLSVAGKTVTIFSLCGIFICCGAGCYIMFTGYGLFALEQFIGRDMYTLMLPEDPSNWPWHAFIDLPLIPISLIMSRTRLLSSIPLLPLFLAWPGSELPNWGKGQASVLAVTGPYAFQPLLRWPPSPLMFTILFPVVHNLYRKMLKRLRHWVMGAQPADHGPVRRLEWAMDENGPAQLRVRIDANVIPAGQQRRGQRQEAQAGVLQDEDGDLLEDEEDINEVDNAVAAEQTIRLTGASMGRFIGGALMIPTISKWMGSILFYLSKRSTLLRKFLAVRPPLTLGQIFKTQWIGGFTPDQNAGLLTKVGSYIAVTFNTFFGGTKVWAEADPVWWRNTVGLGIFVVAKDCLNLLHVYLTKREIESRHVKSRSFAGVDTKELDLIGSPQVDVPTKTPETATTETASETSAGVAPK